MGYDAADFTFPSVSMEHVILTTAYVPRSKWQRRLSWLVRKWRYSKVVKV